MSAATPQVVFGEHKKLQLLTDFGVFNGELQGFLDRNSGLNEQNGKLFVVSIIGLQSSGKSTLLNHLFNTDLSTMKLVEGQSKTTKGVWMCCTDIPNVCVLDVEGTDGAEAQGERGPYESRVCLFSLSISDVLIFNVHENLMNLYQASGQVLLKTIFRVNAKSIIVDQAEPSSPSRARVLLLYVIRDASGQTPLEVNRASIQSKLHQLWADVTQGVGGSSAQLQFDQVFELRVIALPSFHYKKDDWLRDVRGMRTLFEDAASPDYFFKERDRSVPFSGFGRYASDVWAHIQANQDLDIPSLQSMLATHKCQIASGQVLKSIRDNLKQNPCRLEAQLFQKGCEAWASWQPLCCEWVGFVSEQAKAGNANFLQAMVGYKESAVAEERLKLNGVISSEVAFSVGNLLDSLLPHALQLFQSDLQKLSGVDPSDDSQPDVAGCKDFHSRTQALFQETLAAFDLVADVLAELPDAAGSDLVQGTRERMLAAFGALIAQTRNEKASKLRDLVLGRARAALLGPLRSSIESPKANLWTQIDKKIQEAQAQGFQIRNVQARGIFGADVAPSDLNRICSESDMQSYLKDVVAEDIRLLCSHTRDLQRIAFDAFDRSFNSHRTKKWSTFDNIDRDREKACAAAEECIAVFESPNSAAIVGYHPLLAPADAAELRALLGARIASEVQWAHSEQEHMER